MTKPLTKEDIQIHYNRIWHREPRPDEIANHLKWQTPFTRLINWLVDETPDHLIDFKEPVDNYRISAYFLDPNYKKRFGRSHYGVDFALPCGKSIITIGQGIVEKSAFSDSYGNHVIIRHNKHYRSLYGHLSSNAEVLQGWFVPNGYKIGTVGTSGWSTGCHTHLEIHQKQWWGWQKINPLSKILKK